MAGKKRKDLIFFCLFGQCLDYRRDSGRYRLYFARVCLKLYSSSANLRQNGSKGILP